MRILPGLVSLTTLIMSMLVMSQMVNAEEKGSGDLRASAQNSISSMISLPLKLTADQGEKMVMVPFLTLIQ